MRRSRSSGKPRPYEAEEEITRGGWLLKEESKKKLEEVRSRRLTWRDRHPPWC